MKPKKNRIMCPDCGKPKILFKTEKEANTFLKFNMNEVNPKGDKTMRVYYCPACCGYHISSHKYKGDNKSTEHLVEAYNNDVNGSAVLRLFEELVKADCKTRTEVVDYLRSHAGDATKECKQKAKHMYYAYKDI